MSNKEDLLSVGIKLDEDEAYKQVENLLNDGVKLSEIIELN
ncbi:MAG: hypothetical protein ACFFE4_23625 [Candidatus Thorarchaeota archaeon]